MQTPGVIPSTRGGSNSIQARKVEHIHFIACSNKLSVLEMSSALVEDLKRLERGISVFDAFLRTDYIILIAPVLCALCDNVRAAELASHLGSKAKMLCRKCMVSTMLHVK